jgi:2-keto-4-pentenoate hydratase
MKMYMKKKYLLLILLLLSGCNSANQRIVEQIIKTQNENAHMIPPSVQGLRVESMDAAYEIQELYNAAKSKSHGKVSGYKVAYASKESQEANGISEPVYGVLFEGQKVVDKGAINVDDFSGFHIEAEIAFIIDKDVPKTVSVAEELKSYIRSVQIGYDIPDNIFDASKGKPTPADIVIFGAGAHSYAIGSAHKPDTISFSGNSIEIFLGDKKVYEGNENNTMGSPLNSLFWLHEKLQSQGKSLQADDVVLCGALSGPYKADGDNARGVYTAKHPLLGELHVEVK